MTAWLALLRRDLALAWRQGADVMAGVVFFVLAATLFPLGVGPEANLLARIAAGVLWVTALLAAMLSLDRLFQPDHDDGTLEHLLLAPHPLALLVLGKILAHWLTTGLPLLVVTPVLAVMLNLPIDGLPVLLAAMALGTPCLSLFGAIGAALTLGARRGAALVPLLVVPLVLPVLIFGVGAVEAAVTGLGPEPHLAVLGALLLTALALAPPVTALALRQSVR